MCLIVAASDIGGMGGWDRAALLAWAFAGVAPAEIFGGDGGVVILAFALARWRSGRAAPLSASVLGAGASALEGREGGDQNHVVALALRLASRLNERH